MHTPQPIPPSKRGVFGLPTLLLGLCFSALAIGCSGEADAPPAFVHGAAPPSFQGTIETGPCSDGTERRCSRTIQQANGVVSCWQGRQYCVEGEWSPCLDENADPPEGYVPGGAGGAAGASGD